MPSSGTSTAFKDNIDAALVGRLAAAFGAAAPGLDVDAFGRSAVRGLSDLELKARISHVAGSLAEMLPDDVTAAIAIVDDVLAMPGRESEAPPAGLDGWDLWPVAEWVALAGRDRAEEALELLARLTRWASGEFAIRPFIDDDPAAVHDRLVGWADRDDEHVRRLVSEGTRPKLPWAPKLAVTANDPAYAVDLLDRLVDDRSEYVRRSVSNHLNDLCRVDPSLALEVAGRWLRATPTRRTSRPASGWCGAACGHWSRPATRPRCGCSVTIRMSRVRAELVMSTPSVAMGEAAEWVLHLESLDDRDAPGGRRLRDPPCPRRRQHRSQGRQVDHGGAPARATGRAGATAPDRADHHADVPLR